MKIEQMSSTLKNLLPTLNDAARRRGLSRLQWASRAGVRAETLSRLAQRGDCDLTTLSALADAVGLRVALTAATDETMPSRMVRDHEERLLALAASRSLDLAEWREAGGSYFMSGFATLVANARGLNRNGLLALAEALHPGMTTVGNFKSWLARSPLSPSRFLPMLEQRLAARA